MMNPQYPVYIISKNRWDSRYTQRTLEEIGVPYRIVIEPQEYDQYAQNVPESKILVLPFSNLGQGSIPARNWVWEHSISEGHKRHWILDDNIRHFYRFNRNKRIRVGSGTTFRAAEDFTDRFTNVALSGMNYRFFCPSDQKKPAFYKNTRIYSCILIDNSLDVRWDPDILYNEDTDLSLRVMKQGYSTILFNAFLAGKSASLQMKGGNTEEVYGQTNKRYEFAKALQERHPDEVRIVWRYNRWHHHVDYSGFAANPLIPKDHGTYSGIDNYGMKLVKWKEVPYEQ